MIQLRANLYSGLGKTDPYAYFGCFWSFMKK